MATFKPIVFTTKNHIKSDGTTNIKIRIYHNKDSQYVSTPFYVEPVYFEKSGTISKIYYNSENLNFELVEITQKLRKKFIELGNNRTQYMSCIELRDYLVKSIQQNSDFIDFSEFCEEIIRKTKKKNTAEWYSTSLKALQWYFKSEKINVRSITSRTLNECMEKLRESGVNGTPLEPGTVSSYMRGIRSLFGKCKDFHNNEDFGIMPIPHNPFKRLKIPEYKRKRKNLQIDAIKQIRNCKPIFERQIIAKDMFMAMFYLMGINPGDLFKIKGVHSGRIKYKRSKTNTERNTHNFPLSIRIEPELKEIIERYSDTYFFSKIHERYTNDRTFKTAINKGLKEICKDLDIPKATCNWARHSWASIARNNARIPKADVDFCLGHVSNDYRMADIYIEVDYDIFDDTNRKVLDLLL